MSAKYEIRHTSFFGDTEWRELNTNELNNETVKPWIPLLEKVPKVTFGCYNMCMFTSLRSQIGPVTKDLKNIQGWKKLKRGARRAIRSGTWGDQNWAMECYSDTDDNSPSMHIDRNSLRYNNKERDLSPDKKRNKIRKMKEKIKRAKKNGYKHPEVKKKRKAKNIAKLLKRKIPITEDYKMCKICSLVVSARDLEKSKGFYCCTWCMNAYDFKPTKRDIDSTLPEEKND